MSVIKGGGGGSANADIGLQRGEGVWHAHKGGLAKAERAEKMIL